MRRTALPFVLLASAGMLSGCTGFGVFLDHTDQWFGHNPNSPAGDSETFARVNGRNVDITPLVPENGNVWPTNTGPDLTTQDVEQRQNEELRRAGQPSAATSPAAPPVNGPNDRVNRANQADRGLPAPSPLPPPPRSPRSPTVNLPSGPSLETQGGSGYKQLQSPNPGGSGILVPNGNGTSTLIGPDGSIQTVPTR